MVTSKKSRCASQKIDDVSSIRSNNRHLSRTQLDETTTSESMDLIQFATQCTPHTWLQNMAVLPSI